jgi:hypothetical protein
MENQTIPPSQAAQQLSKENQLPVIGIRFQLVEAYTTFTVEYAISEGDIIFHFYPTLEVQKLANPAEYWHKGFPEILDRIARAHFEAEFPKLKAAYTEEKASWWMRAFGFGMVLEPHKLVHNFFDKLDEALEPSIKGTT